MAHDQPDNDNHDQPQLVDAQGPETEHSPSVHAADTAHGPASDTSDVSTLVPTNWKQLIFPAVILIIVAILVAGPVMNAFGTQPAPPEQPTTGQPGQPEPTATVASGAQEPTSTPTIQPTATTAAQASPTSSALSLIAIATRTAVAVAGEQGVVSRSPVQLLFGGVTFQVVTGNNLLPDWKPSTGPTIATWIEGTYANHVLYVPFSQQNQALFQAANPGDNLSLMMNTGQDFVFQVTRTDRAINGPATAPGQFTVTAAMAQDHAGVTLFLIGDPAPDRAVIQADFTGTIQ